MAVLRMECEVQYNTSPNPPTPFPSHKPSQRFLFSLAVEGGGKLGGAQPLPHQMPLPRKIRHFPNINPGGRGLGWGVELNFFMAMIFGFGSSPIEVRYSHCNSFSRRSDDSD
jgi:hypothetical protein